MSEDAGEVLVYFRERCADLLGLNGLFESSGLGFLVGEKEGEREMSEIAEEEERELSEVAEEGFEFEGGKRGGGGVLGESWESFSLGGVVGRGQRTYRCRRFHGGAVGRG